MAITPLPAAPSRSDTPENFANKANTFLAALPTMVSEINANNIISPNNGTQYMFPAGSASTPSISTTGDTNTGIYFPTSDNIAISIGGTEMFRINASGYIGIKTSNPTADLDVRGAVLAGNGTLSAGISYSTRPLMGSFSNHDLYFLANSITHAALTTNGEFLIGSTVCNHNGGDLQIQRGVTFPSTQVDCSDPNTLDDYEEGTWTPSTPTSGLAVISIPFARYTKIGNRVDLYTHLALNNTSGASITNFLILGLPLSIVGNFAQVQCSYATGGTIPNIRYCEISDNSMTFSGGVVPTGTSVWMFQTTYWVN